LRIDLQLRPITTKGHIIRAKNFLKFMKDKPLQRLSVEDIRAYLSTLTELNPATYANIVKSLRRFIRDFLGKSALMKTFKLPYVEFQPKEIPTKEQVRAGYYALRTDKQRLIYLLYAVTGLRQDELRNLKLSDIDLENRCIKARHDTVTKRAFCTFWNDEADVLLRKYLKRHVKELNENGGRLFNFSWSSLYRMRKLIEDKVGVRITPRVLRRWFCNEMLSKGVQEVYVDAFCGRVPKSVLARHYTDFNPERLKEVYNRAGLRILG
jgi:integrase